MKFIGCHINGVYMCVQMLRMVGPVSLNKDIALQSIIKYFRLLNRIWSFVEKHLFSTHTHTKACARLISVDFRSSSTFHEQFNNAKRWKITIIRRFHLFKKEKSNVQWNYRYRNEKIRSTEQMIAIWIVVIKNRSICAKHQEQNIKTNISKIWKERGKNQQIPKYTSE